MGALLDTVNDALRPLPGAAPVLRRAAMDAAEVPNDEGEGTDSAALTLYRLQKDGGVSPPVAPLRGPSTPDPAASSEAGQVGGVANEATRRTAHPRIGHEHGLERGEQGTRHVVERKLGSLQQSRLIIEPPVPRRTTSGFSRSATAASAPSPVVASAPVERVDVAVNRSKVARGAPSEDPQRLGAGDRAEAAQDSLTPGGVAPPQGVYTRADDGAAPPLGQPPHETVPPLSARRVTPSAPVSAPVQVARAAPAMAAPGGLRIGRIEVTVLAEAAPARPAAAAPGDGHVLSRHYLRRT